MGEDLETRKAEFYHDWHQKKVRHGFAICFAVIAGFTGLSRLYVGQKFCALLLFFIWLMISVLSVNVVTVLGLLIIPIWLFEIAVAGRNVRRHNKALEMELIEKWGKDAVSK